MRRNVRATGRKHAREGEHYVRHLTAVTLWTGVCRLTIVLQHDKVLKDICPCTQMMCRAARLCAI